MKKIIILMALFAILFGLFSISISANSMEDNSREEVKNAKSADTAISFKEKYATVVITRTSHVTRINYPEYYGGMYIDSNNDLHILYVDNRDQLSDVCDFNVRFDQVDFGYNYLKNIQELLSDYAIKLSINSVYVSEIDNKVIVKSSVDKKQILDFLSDKIEKFNEHSVIVDLPAIICYTDGAGQKIKSGSGKFTLGYNAYKASTGKYGFVTCGHAVSVGDKVKLTNFWSTTLGVVQDKQLSNTIDAAFVPYSNQSRATPTDIKGYSITGTRSSVYITVGMQVWKFGATTNNTTGFVTATSTSVVCDGVLFTDQIQLNISQKPGDSGGPVLWCFVGPLPPGVSTHPQEIVGIATMADSSTWQTAYVSKAENINAAFGLSTYIAY